MNYITHHGHGLHRLIYVSYSTYALTPDKSNEIAEIVTTSSARNTARAVTGALLIYGDLFVQVLEGDHPTLERLFRTIEMDARHKGVVLKGVEAIEKRAFGRWGMRIGTVPAEAASSGLGALDYAALLTVLKLSVRPLRRLAA